MTSKKVVILGGYGSFGSLISDRLAGLAGVEVIVSGRSTKRCHSFAEQIHARFMRSDVSDEMSLRKTIEGATLVINATGPYLPNEYSIPKTCLSEKCNYIDLGDGREYVRNFMSLDSLAKQKRVFACTGASTTPAVTSVLVDELRKEIDEIIEIKIAMSPGTKNPAGVATFESILSYVGKPIIIWRNGRWEETFGWSEGEMTSFAPLIGKRRVQLCDIPDLDIFPTRYKADTVIFKAGVELTFLNIALEMLGHLHKMIPSLSLPKLTKPLIFGSNFFKPFGTPAGGLQVWASGCNGQTKSMAVIAPRDGPRIPSSPAVLLAKKLLDGKITKHGAFPCMDFIRLNEFSDYLTQFGISIRKVG